MLEGMNIQEDEEVSSVSVDSIDTEDILEEKHYILQMKFHAQAE